MKCFNCKCQVSSDFKYSFSKNCCPKCGNFIMKSNVKNLYEQIQIFLEKDNNDVGDLAVWLTDSYIPNIISSSTIVETKSNIIIDNAVEQKEVNNSISLNQDLLKKDDSSFPSKTNKDSAEQSKSSKLENNRASLFAKRAGVDKIKFETLVKDIQGSASTSSAEFDDNPVQDNQYDDDDMGGDGVNYFNESPLSSNEINQVASLFNKSSPTSGDFSEIEKLQKIEQLSTTGSVGIIRRSS